MADPLSVAASVVGLLTAAAQVSQTITNIIQRSKKAPKECHDVKLEVDSIRSVLNQLQKFLLGAIKASRSRTSLILVDQVVTVLAASVTTFSELDIFVDILDSDSQMGILDRLRWASKVKSLSEIVSRLQMHKGSMILMLTILTCQSALEAEDTVDRLCTLVEQTLKSNVELAERLLSLEPGKTTEQTVLEDISHEGPVPKPKGDHPVTSTDSTLRNTTKVPSEASPSDQFDGLQEPVLDEQNLIGTQKTSASVQSTQMMAAVKRNSYGFAFEEQLMSSRAYRNAASDDSDGFSILSSAGRTGSWSMLSGLSLSEMSNIAILALPIYATDISNRDLYDFSELGDDHMPQPAMTTESYISPPLPASLEKKVSPKGQRFLDIRQRLMSRRRKSDQGSESEIAVTEDEPGVMGIALSESIKYANVAIKMTNEEGEKFTYGYIPVLVAKCGFFLKEKGTEEPDIFAKSGNPRRVFDLQKKYDGGRYGKGVEWVGYTIHDCAALLLRYLKSLPEPVIPMEMHESFKDPLRSLSGLSFDYDKYITTPDFKITIARYRKLVAELPPLNRQLLVYMLDLLAVFAYKSDLNRMDSSRLAATFRPGILSHPQHDQSMVELRLSLNVMIFLIESQYRFILEI